MSDATAIIRWLPESRGGRTRPPETSEGYAAPARFESDVAMAQGAWSVRLSAVSFLSGNACVRATVRFLADEAPAAFLQAGERFELLEGRRVVAKCVVIPQSISVPAAVTEFDLALLG